jgi:hypothetical protein
LTQKDTLGQLIPSRRAADHHPVYGRLIGLANAVVERLLGLNVLKNIYDDIPARSDLTEF